MEKVTLLTGSLILQLLYQNTITNIIPRNLKMYIGKIEKFLEKSSL